MQHLEKTPSLPRVDPRRPLSQSVPSALLRVSSLRRIKTASPATAPPRDCIILLPFRIPRLSAKDRERVWPLDHDASEFEFGREMRFTYIPQLVFSQLLSRVIAFDFTVVALTSEEAIHVCVINEQHFYIIVHTTSMSLTTRLRFRAASIESVLVASGIMQSTLADLDKVLIAPGSLRPSVQILCHACMMLGCH